MNARISSIRLEEKNNGFYWKITLVDELGNVIGTFGDENHCNDIEFRKQTFYLMKILNNWDLLKLDGLEKKVPVLVDNEFYRINTVANQNGECLRFDYETGGVIFDKGCDVSQFCKRNISSLASHSGTFFASVTSKYSHRGISGDLTYLGFNPLYPIPTTEEQERHGAECFKTFVAGILRICNIKELIQSKQYPEVSVKLGTNGDIIAIGNLDETEYLYIAGDGYEFIEGGQKRK